jgi:hypothetical protein
LFDGGERYNRCVTDSILRRIPVVGGLAYLEHVRRLPSAFTATLQVEPDNRYFRHAIAVVAAGAKVGYIAPEVARRYYPALATAAEAVSCPGRRALHTDHETSGVELFLDFTDVQVAPEP